MEKKLAEVIKLAAKLREDSWRDSPFSGYELSLREACHRAAFQLDEMAVGQLVYLAMEAWWNDALDWADEQLAEPAIEEGS